MQGAQILRNEAYFSYAAMTKDEAQHRRWTFYEAVNVAEVPVHSAKVKSVTGVLPATRSADAGRTPVRKGGDEAQSACGGQMDFLRSRQVSLKGAHLRHNYYFRNNKVL